MEIDKLGYEALLKKLRPAGPARFVGLQPECAEDGHLAADKPLGHTSGEEI